MIHEWNKSRYKKENINKIWRYTQNLQKAWSKIEKKALKTLSKVSGLKWKKDIEVHIVSYPVIAFSEPLTLCSRRPIKEQIKILLHELIHNILIQNMVFIKLSKKYGKISFTTSIHVLVHAIEKEAVLKLFGEKELKKVIVYCEKSPDYKKAWDIVEKEGSKKIIRDNIK